jgi:predicted ribosomally synthesized peptide with SipW-like signal peptide
MKKIGLICLAVVLALGGFGVGYAAWTDTVLISGPVTAGTLNLAFDFVEPPIQAEFHWHDIVARDYKVPGEFEGKDVGNPNASYDVLETDPRTGKQGYEKLVITIEDAYPFYIVHTTFVLHNIGTVPLDIISYTITGEKQELDGTWIYDLLWDDPDINWKGSLYEDVNKNGLVDIGIDHEVILLDVKNTLPYQIDPCNDNK